MGRQAGGGGAVGRDYVNGLYSPWNSPGQDTGVGNLSLLQGIFPMQGLNPGLLDSLPAEPPGEPILNATTIRAVIHTRIWMNLKTLR